MSGGWLILSDPTGAVFALWEGHVSQRLGFSRRNAGAFCWFELATTDTGEQPDFYSALFEWKAKPSSASITYTEFYGPESHPFGGMLAITPGMGKIAPHWLAYFSVADCDESARKARALGGGWLVPPMEIPKVGRSATLTDPQGAPFAVIQLAER